MDLIVLKSNECILKLSANSQKWCQVLLIISGQEYYLGSDKKELILRKIFNALSNEFDSPIGEINGVPVSWVLSLSEGHSTIYVGKINATRCLYFEDIEGQLIADILLSQSDLEVWLAYLSDYETNI